MVKTTTARFANMGFILVVSLKKGKKAYQVSAKRRAPGEKAKLGCHESFSLEEGELAKKAFDALVATAETKGWKRAAKTVKVSFTEIPDPPAPAAEEISTPGGIVVKTISVDPTPAPAEKKSGKK